MQNPLSPKQLEFIIESSKRWDASHNGVKTGKTISSIFRLDEKPVITKAT